MSRAEKRQAKEAAKAAAKEAKAAQGKKLNPKEWAKSFGRWFKGLKRWKQVCLIVAVILLVTVVAVATATTKYVGSVIEQMYEAPTEDYDLSLTDVDGYINILLLGVDSRDMDDLDGARSDAIMIVSINEETNDVKLISIYRDTYLRLADMETYDKITHACAYGGAELTMKTLNEVMDLNISSYVMVNFKAVADLVDAVGGITVDVEEYEITQLNKYTIATAETIGRESYNLVTEAGTQVLDGVQAVSYGRIRKGVGDDFKRTERMRTVLTLVFNKMKTMSFSEIKSLINIMTSQVKTNLTSSDILALGFRLANFNISGSVGWPYSVTTGYLNSISYVFPVDLAACVTQLHQEVFEQEDYEPSETVLTISNAIASRLQSARDNAEIEDETEVDTTEEKDPTQVDSDTTDTTDESSEDTGGESEAGDGECSDGSCSDDGTGTGTGEGETGDAVGTDSSEAEGTVSGEETDGSGDADGTAAGDVTDSDGTATASAEQSQSDDEGTASQGT